MRVAVTLLVAVGLPFLHAALAANYRSPALIQAAFSSPSLIPPQRPLIPLQHQRQAVCTRSPGSVPLRHHRTRARHLPSSLGLTCTAVSGKVTLLEGTYSIDGFRSNYIVARPAQQQQQPEGDAAGTAPAPLVLIHGLGSNKAHFTNNLEALAARTGSAVYAVDLLGHGQSAKPLQVSYDSALWDWQVEALLRDVICAKKVFLIGHSLGGYVAMRLAARSPRLVAGLCLLAPAGRYGVLHPLSFNVPLIDLPPLPTILGALTFSKFSSRQAMKSTLEYLYKDARTVKEEMVEALAGPWQDDKSRAAGQAMCSALYRSALEAPWEKLISEQELRTVVTTRKRTGASEETFVTMTYCGPILTIWGTGDALLPPETNIEALKKLRTDDLSEVRLVDAGHCPHDERPEEVNELISQWVSKVISEDVEFPIPRKARYRNAPITDASILKI